jgi:hypothetical protein
MMNNMKYVEVFWSPYFDKTVNLEYENNVVFTKPKPFFPLLMNVRQGMPYLKCPAMVKKHQNDFVISAPYDLVFTFDDVNKIINTDRYGQAFVDTVLFTRWKDLPEGMSPIVQGVPRYMMYSFDDVEIELADLPIISSKFTSNAKVMGGTYNISKWYRPFEVAFEVIDTSKPVMLEADEPMCLLRFHTPNNVPVKLTRVDITPELDAKINSCLAVKKKRVGLKLEKMYELAADCIELFKKGHK